MSAIRPRVVPHTVSRRALIALTATMMALAVLAPRASTSFSFQNSFLVDASNRNLAQVLGDFNEDGINDLFTADDIGAATLMIGRGTGWFDIAPGYPVSVPGNPTDLVAGDFDHDGHLDVAIARRSGNAVSVLLGNGAGGLISNLSYAVGSQPFDIATGDFNGDGHLDLVTANQANTVPTSPPSVSLLIGDGLGAFSPASTYTVGGNAALARGVAVGDVTGDGKLDVVVVNSNANAVRILTGDGNGALSLSPTAYSTTKGPRRVVLADFDGNGSLDIATADSGDGVPPPDPSLRNNQTTVLLNNGAGVFTAAPGSPFVTGPARTWTATATSTS
jgi:hypothetical protein